jgi:hypothetical protein
MEIVASIERVAAKRAEIRPLFHRDIDAAWSREDVRQTKDLGEFAGALANANCPKQAFLGLPTYHES